MLSIFIMIFVYLYTKKLYNQYHYIYAIFRHFCDIKGWEQPTVASLGADGIPPSSSIPMSSMAATEATDDDDDDVKKDLVLSSATVSDSGDSNGYEGDNTGKSILLPIASPIVVADKITM